MNKIVSILLLALSITASFLLIGMKSRGDANAVSPGIDLAAVRAARLWNKHAIDAAVSLLKQGNIVLRSGLGADSYMLSQMNRRDKTYSHCGIVLMENGYPFVYHCIGGEDVPDARLRKDSAKVFFTPLHNDGIAIVQYNFNDKNVTDLMRVVTRFYQARPKFDLKFDLATDDALYCSEFVYKALNEAKNDTAYILPSKALGRAFVGIDDLFLNEHAHITWRIKFK
jgi:hypothetical protein